MNFVWQKIFRNNRILLISVLLAITLRLFWILYFQPAIASDARWYYEKACQLANGEGYHDEGKSTAFYPVGYPVFLAGVFKITGCNLFVARIVNLLLYIVFIIIFFHFLLKIQIQENIAALSALFVSAYPNHVAYVNLLYSENLFIVLFFIALFFYFNKSNKGINLVLSGFCFGLAVLVRPAVLFIPLLLIIFFMPVDRPVLKLKKTIFIYSIIVLTVLPWSIRNYVVMGSFVWVSTTTGYDLLIGNNPEAIGNFSINEKLLKSIPQELTEIQYDIYTKKLALNFMLHNPLKVFQLFPRKLAYFFWPPSEGIGWNQKSVAPEKVICLKFISKINNMIFLVIIAMIVFYAIIGSPNKLLLKFLLISSWYYIFLSLIFFGESRFHYHLIPVIMAFLVNGIASNAGKLKIKLFFPYPFSSTANKRNANITSDI